MRHLLLIFTAIFSMISPNVQSQWVQVKTGNGGGIYSFAFNSTNLFGSSFGQGVFRSTDNGLNWFVTDSGLTDKIVSNVFCYGNSLFAGTMDSGAYRSINNGISWTHLDSGISTTTDVRSFASLGTIVFAGTMGGVLRSTDGGASWINTGVGPGGYVFSLAVSETNLFAGTMGGVFFSSDTGNKWKAVNTGLAQTDIRFIAVSGTNVFACTSDSGIFLTTNNGTTWSAINSGLMNLRVNAFAVNGTYLFAGTGGGVFGSSDNGNLWREVNTGFTEMYVGSLSVIGTSLFLGTPFGSIWRRSLSEMVTSVSNNNHIATYSSLHQNYPDPFNPSTNISFSISSDLFVTLKIYDLVGREVATVVNNQLSPGNYTYQWNAATFASGIYFYRLSAGPFTETKKLIFQR